MKLYTIGYGGRQPQDFVKILKENGIKVIVDVRLRPERASIGLYAKAKSSSKGIQGLLKKGGIEYIHLVELGNIFLEYDDWQEKYKRLFEKAGDLLTERLTGIPAPFCLLCAEKQVTKCHRQYIAEYLVRQGWEVEHIG